MSKITKIDDLEIVVSSILDAYTDDIKNGIKSIAKEVATKGRNDLRKLSPRKTGDYYKGWRIDTRDGSTFIHCTIYNKTNYQLTHLLEKGHRIVRGGKTVGSARSIPHISIVEKEVNNEFVRRTEELIRGGR